MGDLTVRLTTRLARGETILFLVFLALTCSAPTQAAVQGASQHRAGLVVRFGDASVLTRCVAFSEPSITSVELLTRAGLPTVIDLTSMGARVCKIGRDGCDRGKSCFCQCEGNTCAYWQYFHWQSGAWKYSSLGAGAYQVADGAVEGWAWGNNIAPPTIPFNQICSAGSPVAVTSAPIQPSPLPTTTLRLARSVPTASATATPSTAPTVSTAAPTGTPARVAPSVTVPPTVLSALQSTLSPAPRQTPAPTATTAARNTGSTSSFASYAFFGVIVLGLGAWLAARMRRRRRAQRRAR